MLLHILYISFTNAPLFLLLLSYSGRFSFPANPSHSFLATFLCSMKHYARLLPQSSFCYCSLLLTTVSFSFLVICQSVLLFPCFCTFSDIPFLLTFLLLLNVCLFLPTRFLHFRSTAFLFFFYYLSFTAFPLHQLASYRQAADCFLPSSWHLVCLV